MEVRGKATRITLTDLSTPQMRAFHLTWFAFFLCFFGWFGIAPLMAVVREDLMLTKVQIGNTVITSVAITVLIRLLIGPLCDRYGARLTYSGLLLLASLPVMGIGLAHSYTAFLLFRLAIGAIGASFVITQYHTSIMFAPNCVGTANATTAGWGNLGGGVTQIVMPLIFAACVSLGVHPFIGWRLAMVVPGVVLFATAFAYYFLTQDAPEGNYKDLRAAGALPPVSAKEHGSFLAAARDYRVWALFVVYAACFGIELTINNIAALYYHDRFLLDVKTAGLIAGLFGLMNIFARTLGGVVSDRCAVLAGLKGRVWCLGMDPTQLFCPNRDCPARGQLGKGNISVHSRKERRFICRQCGKTFAERTGTPFYRLRTPTEIVTLVVTLLAHGCPVQAIVAAFGLDERTVAAWFDRAGRHCHAVHEHLVETPRRLGHVQADELRVKRQGAFVWMAMAVMVPTRLWLGGEVSPHRDLSLIRRLM